ncbi:MAG TPA: DUF6600 domain-containing protein [Burkholderiales bacterium]|nr:DUF6600 domain-containing protein [Burkholderiales bacterium]
MANRSRFLLALVLLVATAAIADPPGRVGRISHVQGDVTFRAEDREESTPAVLNWPVTGGNVVATAPYARAEVRIGSTAIRLDGATELEFAALDDERIGLRLVSGSVALRVRNREHAGELEVLTPRGRVLLADTGRYRVDVDPGRDTTLVVVHEGAARFDGPGVALAAGPGQQAEIRGTEPGDARVTAAFRDEFDDWSLARDRRDDASSSARYVSPETTGYDELDAHGDWRESAEYGPVWYPRAVPAGWVPYRDGRWAWIEPWGWTWVDYAPWGFAPFHYGRWALVGGAWGWVPGRLVPRPVYAPALVAWVGRPGFSVSVSIGSVPAVGWFPLAPREVYYPGYRVSPTYVRNVNVTHVTNVTTIVAVDRHPPAHVRHANRPHALTVVPSHAVSGGQSVRTAAIRVRDPGTLAALPVASSAPEVARPAMRERRAPEAPRSREAQQGRAAAPPATSPVATPPRASPPPGSAVPERRNDRPESAVSRAPDRRSGATPEPPAAARQSPPAPVERRDSAPQPDPQAQRPEPRRMPAEPTGPARGEGPGSRIERQQVSPPPPRANPPPRLDSPRVRAESPQPRMDSPRVRAETPPTRVERQHVPEPRVATPSAPRSERQFVPQPRPEPRAVPQPRMDSPRARAEAPQPRTERQHVPEPRATPQPRAEPRAMAQPRMEPPAPRIESPRTATPRQREQGERRGPRDGGR